MSNPESFSNRVRDSEQRRQALDDLNESLRRNWLTLVIGAGVGLLLGLFIGWYLWPVQYTAAWPSELDPEARAQYIAAVADAYVAKRSEEATGLAQRRLAWFGAEIAAEVVAAQRFYEQSDVPDSDIRVTNIEELAATLELSPLASDALADMPAPTLPPADSVTPADPGVPEWLRLGLWMLAAFVLIAGGVGVLRTVMRTPPAESDPWDADDFGEFDEHDHGQPGEPDHGQPGEPDPIDEIVAASAATEEVDGVGYDDSVSVVDLTGTDVLQPDVAHQPAGILPPEETQRNVSVTSGSAGAIVSSVTPPDPDGYGFEPESEHEQPLGTTSTIIIEDVEADDIVVVHDEQESASDSVHSVAPMPDESDDSSLAPVVAGLEVARFTAHFLPSLDEYEEAFTIEDQGGYIGDCGMGVNMKHGLVLHNPEHVSVLDVWLVDLAQETEMTFHSALLVSRHGVENDVPQKLAGGAGQIEVVAPEAGESFQIVGRELLIDCQIVAVHYAEQGQVEGVFTECKIEMVVSRRS